MTTAVDQQVVKQIVLSNSPFGPAEVQQLAQAISSDFSNYRLLRRGRARTRRRKKITSPAGRVRLGVCYYLQGRYRIAAEALSSADGGALAHFYLAKTNVRPARLSPARSPTYQPPPPRAATTPTPARSAAPELCVTWGIQRGR